MIKKKHLILTIIFIAVLILVLLSPLFKVRTVEIVDKGLRNKNFDKKFFTIDSNFFLFDDSSYKDEVIDTGLVQKVEVKKEFFCKVVVEITWRDALISLKSGDRYIILDKDGYVLYIDKTDRGHGCIDGVIVKSARIGETIISKNDYMLENAVNLYLYMLENEHLYVSNPLKPNIVIKGNNIYQIINSKYKIDFGDGEDIEDKFSKAVTIYNEMTGKAVKSGIINVSRHNHYVYETWKD